MHSTCPARLIPLNLITTISSEEQHAVRTQACHNWFTVTSEPANTSKLNKIHLTPKDIDPALVLSLYPLRDTVPFWTRGIFSTWHVSQNSKRSTFLL
jgi:hypothetical protein